MKHIYFSLLPVERFLPFLKYNGTKWCSKCGAHGLKKNTFEKLNRNHDPVTQDNPQTVDTVVNSFM